MTIDKKLIEQFIKVTSKAALASSYLIGKKNKNAANAATKSFFEIIFVILNIKYIDRLDRKICKKVANFTPAKNKNEGYIFMYGAVKIIDNVSSRSVSRPTLDR